MYIWLILALLFSALEALAVSKHIQKLEYIAKPAVMVCLFLWLYSSTGLQGNPFWFGMGILLSLAGDVLLMLSLDRLFLFGLMAFLMAHIVYITGFREELGIINVWSVLLLAIIAINASRLIRRILGALRLKGENKLVIPLLVYGIVISFMLFAAMSTLYDPAWKASAALLVSAGAFLFCTSDVILAWNKFVSPIRNGRVVNIALYHLGQIGLIAGVISQFG
ncbi:MAG: lysoplasmalogenase [Chloroflexi bacterium]|nr:MAG: lysoplasmalogenase [Chloroflexota bacterium]